MNDWSNRIFRIDLLFPIIMGGIVTYFVSPIVADLTFQYIQPIASTISTISGILLGFVMASVTILASAKDNSLVNNAKKTKYLEKLVFRLHRLMAWLLVVCLVFLICLFIPESKQITSTLFPAGTKYIALAIDFGVFVFTVSVFKFLFVWNEFSKFASNM